MLLNQVPVLDKGFVSLVSTANKGNVIKELEDAFVRKSCPALIEMATATLIVKCPLFVQLNLAKFNFCSVNLPVDEVELFLPTEETIDAKTTEDNVEFKEYIHRTSEALIQATKGLIEDGCNRFAAQTITPISTYTTSIVHGKLRNWLKFVKQEDLPKPIELYRGVVEQILTTEWNNLEELKKTQV
jgi:hypothetical protein